MSEKDFSKLPERRKPASRARNAEKSEASGGPMVRYESVADMPDPGRIPENVRTMSDQEIDRRIASDPDAAPVMTPEDWEKAVWTKLDGTEQITLRIPRRVLAHFRATGKGYQSRISAVLSAYVDAIAAKKAG